MTIKERIARAISSVVSPQPYEYLSRDTKLRLEDTAQAALEAMISPTVGMIEAMEQTPGRAGVPHRTIYVNAIKAAIAER